MTQEPGSLPPRERTRGALDAEPRLAWLLRRKVTMPDRVEGYVDRERLVLRAMPTRNRLTVLMAPGRFGKTTLLAECCRRLQEDSTIAAWISIDSSDDADVPDSYIAFAFRYAGLATPDAPERDGAAGSRTALLARALEARAEPFVLVLDDLHRLRDPGSVRFSIS